MDKNLVGAVVSPVVTRLGLEVDRIEVIPAGRRKVVRIFLDGDGPTGRGPSLDEIADATRKISDALDASDRIGEAPYTLEVSSRGVTRPLTEGKHFRRNIGRLVALQTAGASLTARILAVTDAVITLDVAGVTRELALADLTKAVVQVELNRLPAEDEIDDDAESSDDDDDDEADQEV